MKKIITTVGTSIFTNFSKKEIEMAFNRKNPVKKHKDISKIHLIEDDGLNTYGAEEYEDYLFEDLENSIKRYWLFGIKKEVNSDTWTTWKDDLNIINTNASAEITSIINIAQQREGSDFDIYLLTSDTATSWSAATLIKAFFEGYEIEGKSFAKPQFYKLNQDGIKDMTKPITISIKEIDHVAGLTVYNKDADGKSEFETKGLFELIKKVKEVADKNSVLNISGGYKATIPVLTIIGQLEEIPLNYIYEDTGSSLIEIGNLPINFDWDYIYHWELLIRKPSLDYISPLFTALRFLDKKEILNHQHLHTKNEFKSLLLNGEEKNNILKSRSIYSLYCKMIEEKVLIFQDGKLTLTLIGHILQKYAINKQLVGSRRMGYLVELFFYKFFAIPPIKRKTDLIKNNECLPYQINPNPTFSPTKYSVLDTGKVILGDTEKIDVKDIDIELENPKTNIVVLGECKTVWAYINASKKEKYLYQIKARLLRQYYINKSNGIKRDIEVLFLVVNFSLFKDLEFDDYNEKDEEIINAFAIFKKLKEDIQLKDELKEINFTINTIVLTRQLMFNKQQKIDWNSFLLDVDNKNYNKVVFL
jgi:hypothetical protein